MRSVLLACIDIGSNTTRLLVADCADGALQDLVNERAFTRIGKSVGRGGLIPAEKIDETAEVVARQARMARELGAEALVAVATAAIREAPNRAELAAAVEGACGAPLRILSSEEEAKLAFAGATRSLTPTAAGPVAVVDVGGGSTELAVGEAGGRVSWWESFRIGSGYLADGYLRSDPPGEGELEQARRYVDGCFDGLLPARATQAVAVGGTATSLARLLGEELTEDSLEEGLRVLASAPIAEVAGRYDLDPERVRLLPAGILVLQAASRTLGLPLHIGRGGIREGVLLALLGEREG